MTIFKSWDGSFYNLDQYRVWTYESGTEILVGEAIGSRTRFFSDDAHRVLRILNTNAILTEIVSKIEG